MLLVGEHMAAPGIAFTIWAAPVVTAAETVPQAQAPPSQPRLPQVQVTSAAIPPALTI